MYTYTHTHTHSPELNEGFHLLKLVESRRWDAWCGLYSVAFDESTKEEFSIGKIVEGVYKGLHKVSICAHARKEKESDQFHSST
jgi:hypothetical protein